MTWRRYTQRLLVFPAISLILFGGLLIGGLQLKDKRLYPSATVDAVATEVALSLSESTTRTAVACTIYLSLKGFLYGSLAAVLVGMGFSCRPGISDSIRAVLNSARSIPLTLLIPFLTLLPILPPGNVPRGLGVDSPAKDPAWLIAMGVFLYVMMGIIDGVSHRDRERENILLKVARMSRVRYTVACLWWEALPSIATATRLALLLALVLAIVLEQLVPYPGAGYKIANWWGQVSYHGDHPEAKVIALMLLVAALGVFADIILSAIQEFALRWRRSDD